MINTLLTVVVPTYNMESLLGKCLDSLVVKNKGLEVLVVIDGATDNSSAIAHRYEEENPDIFRVIDKENGGHGSCCNVGLKEAKGKYIHFLDSDDWFDEKLPIFLDKLSSETADVVFSKRVDEYSDSDNMKIHSIGLDYDKTYDFSSVDIKNIRHDIFSLHECTFSVDLLRDNGVKFLEHCSYDDTILRVAAFPRVKTISLYNITLYHYLLGRTGQSVDKKTFAKKLNQFIDNYIYLFDYCNKVERNMNDNSRMFCSKVLEKYSLWVFREVWECSYNTSDRYKKLYKIKSILGNRDNYQWVKHMKIANAFYNYPLFICFLYHWYCYKKGKLY